MLDVKSAHRRGEDFSLKIKLAPEVGAEPMIEEKVASIEAKRSQLEQSIFETVRFATRDDPWSREFGGHLGWQAAADMRSLVEFFSREFESQLQSHVTALQRHRASQGFLRVADKQAGLDTQALSEQVGFRGSFI